MKLFGSFNKDKRGLSVVTEKVKKTESLQIKSDSDIHKPEITNVLKTDQKESVEKTPKLEKENFRIDEDLSIEEKIAKGWKEITDPNGVEVLENSEGYVWEYLEGDKIGEQLFTKASAIREADKVGKRLPGSWKVFRDIIKNKYKGDYQAFLKGENIKFCGWRDPINKGFYAIDKAFGFWCEDGSDFFGSHNDWNHNYDSDSYGFSVRCLQD